MKEMVCKKKGGGRAMFVLRRLSAVLRPVFPEKDDQHNNDE